MDYQVSNKKLKDASLISNKVLFSLFINEILAFKLDTQFNASNFGSMSHIVTKLQLKKSLGIDVG